MSVRLLAEWKRRTLRFRFDARTSRGAMTSKDTWFVKMWLEHRPDVYGIGECAMFPGLSLEDDEHFEDILTDACRDVRASFNKALPSSIRYGMEMALNDLYGGGKGIFHGYNKWTHHKKGLLINGLIWMGDIATMKGRIDEKIKAGFKCLKLKIGVDFKQELELIRQIRAAYPSDQLELRVDANGAFSEEEAKRSLDALALYGIHSIEQPIRQGQFEAMARLCKNAPLPIALDEELIGVTPSVTKRQLLSYIRPHYVILKPALCGGFSHAEDWIAAAKETGAGWWATSALESPIGLNALAQWTYQLEPTMPQGLGTGQIYDTNIPSQVELRGQHLWRKYGKRVNWEDL